MTCYSNLRTVLFFFVLIAVVATGVVLSPPAFASGKTFRLKGHFQGAGEQFSGHMTHLGRFQGVIDNSTEPATASWTAANGDTLTNQTVSFEIDFSSPIGADRYPYKQEIEIAGGTGRFHGASGRVRVGGTINVTTFEYDGRLRGRISVPLSRA